MSWSGFRKNKDMRKKCTFCNGTGHLASECPNQPGPAPAPAPAPPPAPPAATARSYASTAATSTMQSATVKRCFDPVAIPLHSPAAAKPNPAAAASTPATAGLRPAAAPYVPLAAQPVTTPASPPLTIASSRPTTTGPNPSAGRSIPSTTASSSAAHDTGWFNVDLASIGIELTQEQKSWSPIKQKHEFGIRVGYGTIGNKSRKPEVLTNYVKIVKRPRKVGVYELKMVHHTDHDGREWLVKDKIEKKAIFEQLKRQPRYQNLSSSRNYATDHDLIRATRPHSVCLFLVQTVQERVTAIDRSSMTFIPSSHLRGQCFRHPPHHAPCAYVIGGN
jgi:hypothetical protein